MFLMVSFFDRRRPVGDRLISLIKFAVNAKDETSHLFRDSDSDSDSKGSPDDSFRSF